MKYILLCAGEDSGDILGESFVRAAVSGGYAARGTGGRRMCSSGMEPVADFESLPVSGFGDVLPHYFQLRRIFGRLVEALESPDCAGFIAIDYPGFNMKLCLLAKRLGKPVLYVAPPQVWAWKKSRAMRLRGIPLAVLFEFERRAYEALGCQAGVLKHPFDVGATSPQAAPGNAYALLLPGSRKRQAVRNLKAFLQMFKDSHDAVKVVAARRSLVRVFEDVICSSFRGGASDRITVEVSPDDAAARAALYGGARYALSAPGTATLELALSGSPLVVATVPDSLTYVLGSLFVKSRYFAMPNILLSREAVKEYICAPWKVRKTVPLIAESAQKADRQTAGGIAGELAEIVGAGKLASEFFSELVQGNPH